MKEKCKDHLAFVNGHYENRRRFLKKGILLGTAGSAIGFNLLHGCSEGTEEEIGPSEDLMREHGLLSRILLIYDHCRKLLTNHEPFPMSLLNDSAKIIRKFIEDYHEKLEEDYYFPLFLKNNLMIELVQVLSVQHKVGREVTEVIISYSNMNTLPDDNSTERLIRLLEDFNNMYRPHAAHEDTVLFPALRSIISGDEYDTMSEEFETKERALLGEGGFETIVNQVADIEKQLGINELSQFIPTL